MEKNGKGEGRGGRKLRVIIVAFYLSHEGELSEKLLGNSRHVCVCVQSTFIHILGWREKREGGRTVATTTFRGSLYRVFAEFPGSTKGGGRRRRKVVSCSPSSIPTYPSLFQCRPGGGGKL